MSLRPLLAVLLSLPLLAGCSGVEAQRAQTLLQQANAAQQKLDSMTFVANVRVEAEGQTFSVKVTGGAAKLRRDPDFFVDVDLGGVPGLPIPGGHMRMVKKGPSMAMRFGEQVMTLPVPATQARRSTALDSFDLARYVKDVKVQGGLVLNGRPVTKIVGVLDTASLLEGVGKLSGYAQQTGQGLPDFGGHVGDTRVVGYVDDQTHLIVAALADVSVNGDGMSAKLHLDYGLTSYNQRVSIPAV